MRMIAGAIMMVAAGVFAVATATSKTDAAFYPALIAFALLLAGAWQLNKGIVWDEDERRARYEGSTTPSKENEEAKD